MKVEKTIEISVAPEKIWSFLVDPAKILMWFDSFKKCEYVKETLDKAEAPLYILKGLWYRLKETHRLKVMK